jgi:hypothetical protein
MMSENSQSKKVSFLIVTHDRLPNEPESWNHIKLYVSTDNFKSCRVVTTYSDLLYTDEFDEYKKRMKCKVISSDEFKKLFWHDDHNTHRNGEYRKYAYLPKDVLWAISVCSTCDHQDCYRGCKTHEILSKGAA